MFADDEITATLEEFLAVREEAYKKQIRAMDEYQSSMDEAEHRVTESDRRIRMVEHNLLRHIGTSQSTNPHEGMDAKDDQDDQGESEYNDASFDSEYMKSEIPSSLLALVSGVSSVAQQQPTHSFDDKMKLRDDVLDFLSNASAKEQEMEERVSRMKEEGVDIHTLDDALESLYQLQVTNTNVLFQSISAYRPALSSKAWANDPEYALLLKVFEQTVLTKRVRKSKRRKLPRANKPHMESGSAEQEA